MVRGICALRYVQQMQQGEGVSGCPLNVPEFKYLNIVASRAP